MSTKDTHSRARHIFLYGSPGHSFRKPFNQLPCPPRTSTMQSINSQGEGILAVHMRCSQCDWTNNPKIDPIDLSPQHLLPPKDAIGTVFVSLPKNPERLGRCFDLDNTNARLYSPETSLNTHAISLTRRPQFRTGSFPRSMIALWMVKLYQESWV